MDWKKNKTGRAGQRTGETAHTIAAHSPSRLGGSGMTAQKKPDCNTALPESSLTFGQFRCYDTWRIVKQELMIRDRGEER